jgi:NADH:ubiquinone oxidoreductase subunit 2 (subunit N)
VVSAAVQQRQYALAVIAMLAAATAAFFYLRIAILMYSPGESSESPQPSESGAAPARPSVFSFGGLAVATPAETRRILIPAGIAVTLAISVAFTLVFGIVPAPVIAFARRALLLF